MEKNGQTVIADCYNASPDSMRAALSVLGGYQCTGRKIAVLGDMLELGQDSPMLHRSVGAYLADKKIERLFTVGTSANQIAVGAHQRGMSRAQISENRNAKDLAKTGESLLRELREGDVVLFKASRGVGAEQIITYLRERI